MNLNDPARGFFHRKPTVRVVVIVLWCLVILLALLTSWTAGVAASGTGGSITDRAPSYPIILVGTFLISLVALIVDITTAKVRDDRAGWSIVGLLGSLGLGLSAGACAHDAVLSSFPSWRVLIMFLIGIGLLCLRRGCRPFRSQHRCDALRPRHVGSRHAER